MSLRFSVVIPLFNKSQHIQKAVNSVLNQTFPDFEIIVVNDGSTDKSLSIVEQIKDERVKIINQPNSGVSTARNNGVKASKYDYIAFLDADDWWDEHFLEEMKVLIEKYPDAGIYGSKYDIVKFGRVRKDDVGLPDSFTDGFIDYLKTYAIRYFMPICSSAVVIKKSVFEELKGFKPQLKFGEDFDLWVRVALKYKVAYKNKSLAYFNQDVDIKNRALGGKLWNKNTHFIFQLDYLAAEEKNIPALKELLDGLRVRSLLRYYLKAMYSKEVNEILSKVDFSKQPKQYIRAYRMPFFLVKMYYGCKQKAYLVKRFLIIQTKRIR